MAETDTCLRSEPCRYANLTMFTGKPVSEESLSILRDQTTDFLTKFQAFYFDTASVMVKDRSAQVRAADFGAWNFCLGGHWQRVDSSRSMHNV
jgi:hypothetical protein